MGITNRDGGILTGTHEYTRVYENMRGVSSDGDQTGSRGGRFGYLRNMYVNYEGGTPRVESIPGYRRIYSFRKHVNGIFTQRISPTEEYLIVHAAGSLYRIDVAKRDKINYLSSIGSAADRESIAFSAGSDLYILDGEDMHKIDPSGAVSSLQNGTISPHVPTVFVNGEPSEARNILCDKVRESFTVGDASEHSYGTPELIYEVVDEKEMTCAVVGISEDFSGAVYVPVYTKIGGKRYTVYEIADGAFSGNTAITELHTYDGLIRIGVEAFKDCTALTSVYMSSTVGIADTRAFYGCTALTTVYIGEGMALIGEEVFDETALERVYYAKTSVEVQQIIGFSNVTVFWYGNKRHDEATVRIPLFTKGATVDKVRVNGEDMAFEYDDADHSVRLGFSFFADADGAEIIIDCTAPEADGLNRAFVLGCGVCRVFDGRVFLSGNPNMPGAVIYSASSSDGAPDPTYFPIDCHFRDGCDDYPVVGLLACGSTLAVLKSGNPEDGSIFYHKRQGKTYPTYYTHRSTEVISPIGVFGEDILFMTPEGVCSLEKATGENYRKCRCRSTNVNKELLPEDISRLSVAFWKGYLLLCFDGNIYLADSKDTYLRDGYYEYEWYPLCDIGVYASDSRVYRYSSFPINGLAVHRDCDCAVTEQVYSTYDEDGVPYYYTVENGIKYSVYRTPEFTGGVLSPACRLAAMGELLFFITEDGELCVFNNDKVGVPPDWLAESEGFDSAEYGERMGKVLHPFFYSFAEHAPVCAAATPYDDCDFSYLRKDTVPGSDTVRMGELPRSEVECIIRTDTGGMSEGIVSPALCFDFGDIDFSNFAFCTDPGTAVVLSERERGWVRKQITLTSRKFCSPIAVYSISHRYKIKGKLKKG